MPRWNKSKQADVQLDSLAGAGQYNTNNNLLRVSASVSPFGKQIILPGASFRHQISMSSSDWGSSEGQPVVGRNG
jgi:hypothetical protein